MEGCSEVWWPIPTPGTGVSIADIGNNRVKVVLERTCHDVTGDKFCTPHGQKGVVTVVPAEKMVSIGGVSAEFVMGTTTVMKRSTPGQIIEAAASMEIIRPGGSFPMVDTEIDPSKTTV